MNKPKIIAHILGSYRVLGKTYSHKLPSELAEWYCYTSDGGHNILVAVKSCYRSGSSPNTFLVPIPVKTVRRLGYTVDHEFIVVDVPYDSQTGAKVSPDEEEY